ncbi:hypothetical protein MNB_SUP05-5-979 [hydrothermal vent metagenome]|uniref:Reverse transcriptase domain-containing protein n=1 Tax=hydrothermal vent metagenome TaxID=652676 RepID=A0A1W1BGL3_9ZZZZ
MGNNKLLNEKKVVEYLKSKFIPQLKKQYPQHPLVNQRQDKLLKFIKKYKATHPYFLKFDIEKYYININHNICLKVLNDNYKLLTNNHPPLPLINIIKTDIKVFLSGSIYKTQGLALGNSLSYLLSYLYLLSLDLKIKEPFLRYADDYVIFFKSKKQIYH